MSDVATVIDRYFAIWNETDSTRRRDLIAGTWTEDATYMDPLMRVDGPDGIDAMVAGVQQQYPGHRFQRTGKTDTHHDRVRFTWEMVEVDKAGESPLVAGVDFGVVAADGRLRTITGFFDHAPGL